MFSLVVTTLCKALHVFLYVSFNGPLKAMGVSLVLKNFAMSPSQYEASCMMTLSSIHPYILHYDPVLMLESRFASKVGSIIF